MTSQTQSYRRSIAGSLGAGMGSLMGSAGKQYYILEHKAGSKYHKAGEGQEIIIDQIEIGRDPKCQVRFDERFETVSRRHAAIIKDGNGWKIVPLSQTNPTFLNGRRIAKEWYLQNGDEIQLAVGGPKLGFIIPSGNKSTVGSIGLSRRLSLFRQQALRPYKRAITTLTVCLILALVGAAGWSYWQYDKWQVEVGKLNEANTDALEQIRETAAREAEARRKLDSLARARPVAVIPAAIETLIDNCKDDIYFLTVSKVYLTDGSDTQDIEAGWSGTGFLLDDGRFVTARHCIHAWRFGPDNEAIARAAALVSTYPDNVQLVAVIEAVSRTGKRFSFKSTDFTVDDRFDTREQVGVYDDGDLMYYTHIDTDENARAWSTDWACIRTSSKGKLTADAVLSNNLRSGKELHVLGFPMAIGVGDTPAVINPSYNKFSVGFDGFDNSGCFLHTRGTEHGNSGGPVFAQKDNKLVVIGIVSRGSAKTDEYNYGVPISAIGN
ncbi:MAG: FHA domain-containing protein [Prevotellaceae bacterium]|jgi:S1-C subfamily serine protease|nr:FHA domain-containing protein [Prevotellaceae bacterium]